MPKPQTFKTNTGALRLLNENGSVSGPCTSCGKQYAFAGPVTNGQIENWKSGMLIQRAFPNLSAEDREFLISGICPTCWSKLFPPDPEDILS